MLALGVGPLKGQDAGLLASKSRRRKIHLQLASRRVLIVTLQVDSLKRQRVDIDATIAELDEFIDLLEGRPKPSEKGKEA